MNLPPQLKSTVDPHVTTFKVAFGDSFRKIECDFEVIEAIYNFVAYSVIPQFARFFPKATARPPVVSIAEVVTYYLDCYPTYPWITNFLNVP